jgi:predicted RecB family nuclease
MPRKINKRVISNTFKFDCDRFLRFQLADESEKLTINIKEYDSIGYLRPAIQLIQETGHEWERNKYQDIIDTNPNPSNVLYQKTGDKFEEIKNILDKIRSQQDSPPQFIIEGSFTVSTDFTEGLKEVSQNYNIESGEARPDLLWIKAFNESDDLINEYDNNPEYVIHIIDVKMAAEPSLKHFTEVTFYALALAKALAESPLKDKYNVSRVGMIWPGSYDNNEFKNKVNDYTSRNEPDPVAKALEDTLIKVPHEVYEVQVLNFFNERLPKVFEKAITDVSWHISSNCQLCQYLPYCQKQAETTKHLSLIPWLNKGQAELIRENRINNIDELYEAIMNNSPEWQNIISKNYQINADKLGLRARIEAINHNFISTITDRKCIFMPSFVHMRIYITIHFDPGTGISFLFGLKRVYFSPNRNEGDPPVNNERVFIIDKIDNISPETERNRLAEFLNLINSWIEDANNETNCTLHFYFWNSQEVKQLKRVIERHMEHPSIANHINNLMRIFPPDNQIPPDIDTFKSQPGTIVKDVVKMLFGLPKPFITFS